MIMFKSLKKWANVSVQIKPFVSYDGAGDKSYTTVINTQCYPEGIVTKVTNVMGNEVVSKMKLYIDGTVQIKVTDIIIFEGQESIIQSLGRFYDTKGSRNLWVVYL